MAYHPVPIGTLSSPMRSLVDIISARAGRGSKRVVVYANRAGDVYCVSEDSSHLRSVDDDDVIIECNRHTPVADIASALSARKEVA